MIFKRMEAFGFKSFADKIDVPLNEGITAIVGPNGCGKSNVVDAIRWVLGEQSAKTLRGKNMQDVIFKGTAIRKELSFCEVSLTFDNTSRVFDYDVDELILSRKLYRSGDSEYFINGAQSRRIDIQNVIRNTGLGKEGYSIVGQGRINEIINAKPENRRAIFEDAAGVLGFKKNKKEAEKRLAETQTNLDQIKIAKDTLEGQRNTLERQSNDARNYLNIRDRLRALEANEYIYQFENHESNKNKIETRLQGCIEEYNQKYLENVNYGEEYNKRQIELHNVDVKIDKMKDKRTEIAVKTESVKGQGMNLQERLNSLNTQKQDCLQRLVQSEKSLEDKNAELKTAQEHCNMAMEDKRESDREFAACNKEYVTLVEELVDRDKKIKDANQELINAVTQEGETKVDIGKLTTQKEFILNRIAELNAEIAEYDRQIKDLEALKREHEKVLVSKKNDLNRLGISRNEVLSEIRGLKEELDVARSRYGEINVSISACKQQIETYKNFKKEYGAFGNAVKLLMGDREHNEQLQQRIEGVVVDLVKVPKEYETAIEVAIGGGLQNIVVENEEDAKYIINYIRERQYGRLTFLPLTSVKRRDLPRELSGILRERGCIGLADQLVGYDKRYSNVFSNLLGGTIIVDSLDNATAIARKYRYAVKIVTLQGDLLSTGGSITGGSRRGNTTKALSYERIIEENEKLLQKLIDEKNKIEKKLSSSDDDLADYEEQLEGYTEDIKNAQVLVATENGKLDKVEANIQINLDALNERMTSRKEFEDRLTSIDNALQILGEKGKDFSEVKLNVDSLASKTREEYEAKTRLRDELSEKLALLRVRCGTLQTTIDNDQENIARLTNEIEALSQERTSQRENLGNLQNIIADLTNNKTVELPEKYQRQYDELTEQINDAAAYKDKLNELLQELIFKKDESGKDLMAINERKVKCENDLSRIEESMNAMQAKMREEYDLDYESALPLRFEEFDINTCRQEIRQLTKARKDLGSVNLESIEDFKTVDETYQMYVSQITDLENTYNDLTKIIAQLSKQILDQFNTEFAKISKNFEIIFKELFGGGNGKLVILPPDEGQSELDAGIEIMAEPPGKKLQSITLLSGGETALTAMAILFAILRLKAMPFCILDEIEAALDDANVGVFAQYLKRFSDETQFIVITHRKPTMELADRLYGVTMQEKGVSKVVAVNLADAVKQADPNA
ncbi:MAG: chromosome segregation protein SMC [Clostridia bacterium]|nr:chromosome segregation protein SMC [Clostridia bacterium]